MKNYIHINDIENIPEIIQDAITIQELKMKQKPKVVLSWAPHPKVLPHAVANSFVKIMLELEVDFSIKQIIVKEINPKDEKYKYLFTVDNMNTLLENGATYSDVYKEIGAKVENGTYVPDTSKKHTHIGSIHNLGLDKIREKFPV